MTRRRPLTFFAMLLVPLSVIAQSTSVPSSLVGHWLVTVDHIPDGETRTLIIASDGQTATGEVVARYGLTSKSQTPVDARLTPNRSPRQLVVRTQAGTNVTTEETSDGKFVGTFVTKGGKSYPVQIVRVTEAQLSELRAAPRPAAAFASEAPTSAPPACAGLEGRWTGTWSQGSSKTWLWIQRPNSNCVARFAYLTEDREPRSWSTVTIQDKSLSFACSSNTGTCSFKMVGEELWASYSGSQGTNSAMFKRVAER